MGSCGSHRENSSATSAFCNKNIKGGMVTFHRGLVDCEKANENHCHSILVNF